MWGGGGGGGITLWWISIPSRRKVEILLVASCYGDQDKLKPDGPLGSNPVLQCNVVNPKLN